MKSDRGRSTKSRPCPSCRRNAGTFQTQSIGSSKPTKECHMTSNISQYILERVDDQIKWHYAVASKNKKKYELFQIITIVAGSIVPLINVIDFLPVSVRVVSAGLGSLITIITSVSQLKKYGENWFLYRKTGESLKREKFLFLHDAGEYSDKDEKEKNKVFVQKIEGLLQQESEMAPKQEAKGKA